MSPLSPPTLAIKPGPKSSTVGMAGLEDLPPDIFFLMLVNASSMEVLWGFIRASPRIFAVFRDQRDVILSTVIIREIGVSVLQEAQSALRSSRRELREFVSKKDTLDWIATYEAEISRDQPVQQTSLGASAVPLWRQHRSVKSLASLYVRERLHIAIHEFERVVNEEARQRDHCYDLEDLSDTEKARLFRGFYRFAIYGNLFFYDGRRGRIENAMYAPEQCENFLCLFPSWQVEELSCVNDFVEDKVLDKWQEKEENEYNTLIAADPSTWDINNRTKANRSDDYYFSTREKRGWQESYLQYFGTLKVPTLVSLFTAQDDKLLQIVKENLEGQWQHDFLFKALGEDPYYFPFINPKRDEQEKKVSDGVTVQFHRDSVSEANEAWLWAHNYQPCDLYIEASYNFPIGEGLRRFGYVFWDSSRLHNAGILEKEFVWPSSCLWLLLT